MSLYRHSFNLTRVLIPFIFIFCTSLFLWSSAPAPLPITPEVESAADAAARIEKETFIRQVIDNDIDGLFDGRPLAEVCKRVKRKLGLVVKCAPTSSGIANTKNEMLNCFRFGIETGAIGLIVPEIIARRDDYSFVASKSPAAFSHFFDLQRFITIFTHECPQMHLYQSQKELAGIPSLARETELSATSITDRYHPIAKSVIDNPRGWAYDFHRWLNVTVGPVSLKKPALVTIQNPLLRWPLSHEDDAFVAQFGRILRYREDIRRLAGTVLYLLNRNYKLNMNLSNSGVEAGKFYGAHVRTSINGDTERDWPRYVDMEHNYLSAAHNTSLSTVYLAMNTPGDAFKFADAAAKLGISVATKESLLNDAEFAAERAEMNNLSKDQKGIIDYEVLLRSSFFGGMYRSTFSWSIALKRHIAARDNRWEGVGYNNMGWDQWGQGGKGGECFLDRLSAIYGPGNLESHWNFPLALWP